MAKTIAGYLATFALFLVGVYLLTFRLDTPSAIYLATGLVILWYTIETWRLRKEAQLQTELQNRPFLSLTFANEDFGSPVYVSNIGKGLARNVTVSVTEAADSFRLDAPTIAHILPGANPEPAWRVSGRMRTDGTLEELSSGGDHRSTARSIFRNQAVSVVLDYLSIVGQRYRTGLRVEKGIVEIVYDKRIRKTSKPQKGTS